MSTVIDATGYQSAMYTLQEVTHDTMQNLLRELWQHEKANPEFCYLSIRDHVRFSVEHLGRLSAYWGKDFSSSSKVEKIVNETTDTFLTLKTQETFSVGTLEFLYRAQEV